MASLALLLAALATAGASTAKASRPDGWVTLMSEDFEGEFPRGLWRLGQLDNPYQWGKRVCNPHQSNYSIWGGGGGTSGTQIPCTGMYVPNIVTVLYYGPLDMSGCTDARINFAHWTWLSDGNTLGVDFSAQPGPWYIQNTTGNCVSLCDGWCEEILYQDRWSIPMCGNPEVYLLFRFVSNADGVSYGAFLDDVSFDVHYEGEPPTPTPTDIPGSSVFLPMLFR